MNIEILNISDLTADPANARRHPTRNLDQIKASLKRFGQQKPVVIDGRNIVRAGNGTLAAAAALGWKTIQAVRSTLASAELTAYAIVDNRSAELAEWDDEILSAALADPAMGDLGFDADEINDLADAVEEPPDLQLGAEKWLVVVTCEDEPHQAQTIERLTAEGFQCKALIG